MLVGATNTSFDYADAGDVHELKGEDTAQRLASRSAFAAGRARRRFSSANS